DGGHGHTKVEDTGGLRPSPKGARAYSILPKDGKTVKKKFKVSFGLKGMGVAPAGIDLPNTGHHHLLINTDFSEVKKDQPLPATDKIKHFGGGQTETMLELEPGKYTLQMVLGDFAHRPHNPPIVSKKITITVGE
ncbi:MAG: DUF4399 domain-containing protein, partial [Verrucomicrobiota bacterium]